MKKLILPVILALLLSGCTAAKVQFSELNSLEQLNDRFETIPKETWIAVDSLLIQDPSFSVSGAVLFRIEP